MKQLSPVSCKSFSQACEILFKIRTQHARQRQMEEEIFKYLKLLQIKFYCSHTLFRNSNRIQCWQNNDWKSLFSIFSLRSHEFSSLVFIFWWDFLQLLESWAREANLRRCRLLKWKIFRGTFSQLIFSCFRQ